MPVNVELVRKSASDNGPDTTSVTSIWKRPNDSEEDIWVGDHTQIIGYDNRHYDGFAIKHFHRLVKKGLLLPHTHFWQFQSSGTSQGSYDVTSEGPTHWWASDGWNEFTSWYLLSEEILAKYLPRRLDIYVQEAAARISSEGYDALTALAEFSEIPRMFLQAGKTLLKLPFRKKWRLLKLKDEWLSGRYGWRTFFYDLVQIEETITKWNEQQRTRHSSRCGNTYTNTYTSVTTSEKAHYTLSHTTVDTVETSLRGSVTADIEVPKLQINPIATAWELIPLSFVVDWFVSVGKAIAAASFVWNQHDYAASSGLKLKVEREYSVQIQSVRPSFVSGNQEQNAFSTASIVLRSPCAVPLAPHLKLNINAYKILDLLALVVQRIRR
jgi:hypothetical protein